MGDADITPCMLEYWVAVKDLELSNRYTETILHCT